MEGSGSDLALQNPSPFLAHSLHALATSAAYDEPLEEMETA
jgi:hypothetical protein